MIISLIILIISFLLDGLMSNYITNNIINISLFSTVYTVIALVIIYKFFSNDKKYLTLISIFGLLFDIVYTNSLFLNSFTFFIIGIVIIFLTNKFASNIINNIVLSLISVFLYYIITSIILFLINYNNFNTYLIFKILYSSIIMTTIYSFISLIIIDILDKKISFKLVK